VIAGWLEPYIEAHMLSVTEEEEEEEERKSVEDHCATIATYRSRTAHAEQ
jgi:hypothetical protein